MPGREAAEAAALEGEGATVAELADAALAAAGLQADDYDAFQAAIEAVESVDEGNLDEALPEIAQGLAETLAAGERDADAPIAAPATDAEAPADAAPPHTDKHEEAAADV